MKTKYKYVQKEAKTGHYYYTVPNPFPGKKKRLTCTFKTAEEAYCEAQKLLSYGRSNNNLKDEDKTVGFYFHNFLDFKKATVKFTTFENINGCKKYISSYENISFKEFCSEANLMIFRESLKNASIGINHKNKILNIIHQFANYVFKTTNIPREYYFRIEMYLKKFPMVNDDVALKSKLNYWTKEECVRFLDVVDSNNYYCLFLTLIITSARLGELQGFCVKDLDLVKKEIRVERQVVSKGIKDCKHAVVTSLKTPSSYRTISLTDKLCELLKKYLNKHPNAEPDDYLFFCSKTPISRTTLRRVFNKYIKKAGLNHITIHGLRRTGSTLMLSNENLSAVDIGMISKRLGHSNTRMTLNVYMGMHKKESEKIKKSLEII